MICPPAPFSGIELAWDISMMGVSGLGLFFLRLISRLYDEDTWDFIDYLLLISLGLLGTVHLISAVGMFYHLPQGLQAIHAPFSLFVLALAGSLSLWAPRVQEKLLVPLQARSAILEKHAENFALRTVLDQKANNIVILKSLLIMHPRDQVRFAQGLVKSKTVPVSMRLYDFQRFNATLAQGRWEPMSLQDIVSSQLRTFRVLEDATIRGPEVLLSPRQAQYMSMAIYELCLNSVQHAQKTKRGARFIISWKVVPRDMGQQHLEFSWHEHTMDVALFPSYAGGHHVLTKTASYAFGEDAKTEMMFLPNDVRWLFSAMIDVNPFNGV
jgi:two-component sensor histidine kinase